MQPSPPTAGLIWGPEQVPSWARQTPHTRWEGGPGGEDGTLSALRKETEARSPPEVS